jgi:hypothetical protein
MQRTQALGAEAEDTGFWGGGRGHRLCAGGRCMPAKEAHVRGTFARYTSMRYMPMRCTLLHCRHLVQPLNNDP